MAMATRLLARLDHLIGAHQVAAGGVVVTLDRIDQDQVTPLGLLGGNKTAGGGQSCAGLAEAPYRGLELGLGHRPHRGLATGPAWLIAASRQLGVIGFVPGFHGPIIPQADLALPPSKAILLPPLPATTGSVIEPTPWMVMVSSSPALSGPTPSGVPIAIISPG